MADVDKSDVDLDVEAGEYLLYTLKYRGERANFSVNDEEGNTVLSARQRPDADGVYSVEWPPDQRPRFFPVDHVLVVAFRTPGKHHYRVVRKNANDVTLEVVKDLRFEGKRGDPSEFNGLSIFLPS